MAWLENVRGEFTLISRINSIIKSKISKQNMVTEQRSNFPLLR